MHNGLSTLLGSSAEAGVESLGSSEPNKINQIFITLVCNIAK
jgi:hypothetical protein